MRPMPHIARLLGIVPVLSLLLGARTAGAEAGRSTSTTPLLCGTPDVALGDYESVEMALRRWHDEATARPAQGIVRVAVHVITARGEGSVTDAQVAALIQRLNLEYRETGYGFQLVGLDRTENPGWFKMTPGSGKERQAKQSLAIDPAHHLNLYVCGPAQVVGWASYPWSASEGDDTHGVVIHYASLSAGVALGRVAAHEVGHYLGIRHDDEMATGHGSQVERMREVVPVFRPSLFNAPVAPAASTPEIVPGVGAEPEEGRVLAYRGAFPNPFRAETAVRFTLPTRQLVSLRIYSVTGQLVRTLVDAPLPPGDHSAMFRADDLPSGAYFALLRVGKVQMSRTVMLVR